MGSVRKIKVLQFVEGLSQGGIESFVVNVYRNLNIEKFTCDFLVLKTAEASKLTYVYDKELQECGSKVKYLIDTDTLQQSRMPKGLKYLKVFWQWFKNEGINYDVVHVHASHLANFYPYLLCMKFCGMRKIIIHSHNSTNDSKKVVFMHKLFRSILKPLHMVCLACGETAGEWMYGSIPFEVIPNGIDLQKFKYSDANRNLIRKEFSISDDTKVLGHVGAFREQKNHSYLVEVFYRYHQKNKDSVLILVGDGQLRAEIKSLIKKLNLQDDVIFLGNRKDVYRILSAMDCFIFPSLYEGLSVAMVEVQANGLPVVMSDTIAPETIMCNKISTCSIDNKEECYEKWCRLIHSAIKHGRNDIRYADTFYKYDIRNAVNKLEIIYSDGI